MPQTPTLAPTAQDSPTPTSMATAELKPADTPIVAASDRITLTLWYPEHMQPVPGQPGGEALAEQFSAFQEMYPNVGIQGRMVKAHGPGGILDYLRTTARVMPDGLPDLVLLDMDEVDEAAALGVLQPLEAPVLSGVAQDLYPFAAGFGVLDGQRVALPYEVDIRFLAYNSAMVTSIPVSWTEPVTLSAPYLAPLSGGNADVTDGILLQYASLAGWEPGSLASLSIDESALSDVFSLFKSLQADGVLSTASLTTTTLADSWSLLAAGQVGASEVSAHQYRQAIAGGQGAKLAYAPIPTLAERPIAIGHGWAWVVTSSDARRQQGALALLSWLMEADNLSARCASSGYLPSLQNATIGASDQAEYAKQLSSLLQNTLIVPLDGNYAYLREWLQLGLHEVLAGSEAPTQAAAEVAERVQGLSQPAS